MNYRKFQADKIFTGFEFLDPGHVLIMDEVGKVLEIVAEMDAGEGIERYRGIICPGFINAHCHLELSHLKNAIPPHTGLIPFLLEVVTKRNHDQALILESIEKAEKEMELEGIVAVGDICNTGITIQTKSKSKIRWNNFIEVLGMKDEKAEANLLHYKGKSSLQSCLPHFNKQQRMILVHNTFTTEQDIVFALEHAKDHLAGIHFCICANANLYIENRMPPIDLLIRNRAEIVLGTDSYSSNWQLSIASEIRTIRKELPTIPLQLILQWATINGARALERDDVLGSFEPGKKPGIVLLNNALQAQKIV